jgi:hypothetical protein
MDSTIHYFKTKLFEIVVMVNLPSSDFDSKCIIHLMGFQLFIIDVTDYC